MSKIYKLVNFSLTNRKFKLPIKGRVGKIISGKVYIKSVEKDRDEERKT